jgi:hypothetical protein
VEAAVLVPVFLGLVVLGVAVLVAQIMILVLEALGWLEPPIEVVVGAVAVITAERVAVLAAQAVQESLPFVM